MTEETGTHVVHPLEPIARHGDVGARIVAALLESRHDGLLFALADNVHLAPSVRDLVVDAVVRSGVTTWTRDAWSALARQSLTGDQRRRLAGAPRLSSAGLAILAAGGPADGVDARVVDHLAEVVVRRQAGCVAADPVVEAVAVCRGWDHLREDVIDLVDEVSGVLASLDPTSTNLDVAAVVAGGAFRPTSYAAGMGAFLRWPEASEVVDPKTVAGLIVQASVASSRKVHRRALREANDRLERGHHVDAERLAESLACNPSVREEELVGVVDLRERLRGGYLHDWYPVPGAGVRADQLDTPAACVKALRLVAARPGLVRRGAWVVAAIARSCKDREVRALATSILRSNRRETLDAESLEWLAGELGVGVGELQPEPRPSVDRLHGRLPAPRPSVEAREQCEVVRGILGEDRDVWTAFEVVARTSPSEPLEDLAHVALGIMGVEPVTGLLA